MTNESIEIKNEILSLREDVNSLRKTILVLTNIIESNDTEFTDSAKKELMIAREESELNYSSLGDVEKEILSDDLSD